MRARDLMQRTSEVVHVDQTLMDADIRLRRHELPALAVVDGDEIVGLITAVSLQSKTAGPDNDLASASVRDHMSAEIAFCHADESLGTARAVLREGNHDYLLVTDRKGRLCGLLSAGQLDIHEERSGEERSGGADKAEAQEHVVETSGRAKGDKLHGPDTYSVDPTLKK